MKSSTKNMKADISNLVVELEDIYYTLPKEMTVQEKQYFDGYIAGIRNAIRDLDIELELYKENGFEEDYANEDNIG